ncbi:hypothetical protein [Dyadobacter aurulentus]|uniref:hypothetical protein n=1 Tax=Dyadobacter sp. UC 10 TaxID=2605428 RepID=UPI001788D45F|nr:hypothetical protein [Dyadobacter sp. UC 10]
MNEFEIRMRIAALRQYLNDFQDQLTASEIDRVIDAIAKYTDLLNEITKRL